jgi:hypothetical protein
MPEVRSPCEHTRPTMRTFTPRPCTRPTTTCPRAAAAQESETDPQPLCWPRLSLSLRHRAPSPPTCSSPRSDWLAAGTLASHPSRGSRGLESWGGGERRCRTTGRGTGASTPTSAAPPPSTSTTPMRRSAPSWSGLICGTSTTRWAGSGRTSRRRLARTAARSPTPPTSRVRRGICSARTSSSGCGGRCAPSRGHKIARGCVPST